MRVLVTGGAGFIGSFVVDRLVAEGHQVRILDRLDSQAHPAGPPGYVPPSAEVVIGDVRDPATCAATLVGMDAVVHAAAAVGIGQSLYRVAHYVDVNVHGTAVLLERLAEGPGRPRLVMLTSVTAYGEGAYRRLTDRRPVPVGIRTEADVRRWGWEPVCPVTREPLVPLPTPEDAALGGRNVYALTKRYQEELALTIGAAYGFPVVCLRLFNVYGPRQCLANPYTGVLAIFLSRLLAGEPPIVYEDGAQTRDFISVHDVVDAIHRALTVSGSDGTVLNIGSGIPRRIDAVAQRLAELAGVPSIEPTITGRFRYGDVRHCVADIQRAEAVLGFRPRVPWDEGLAELVAWAHTARFRDGFFQADQELRTRALVSARLDPPPVAAQR